MRCAAPRRRHLSDEDEGEGEEDASGRHEDAGSANAARQTLSRSRSPRMPPGVEARRCPRRSRRRRRASPRTTREARRERHRPSRAHRGPPGRRARPPRARARRRRRHGLGDRVPRAPRTRQPGCALARAAGCDATRIERVREHAKSATKCWFTVWTNRRKRLHFCPGFSGAPPPHHRRHFDARRRSRRALERVSP